MLSEAEIGLVKIDENMADGDPPPPGAVILDTQPLLLNANRMNWLIQLAPLCAGSPVLGVVGHDHKQR